MALRFNVKPLKAFAFVTVIALAQPLRSENLSEKNTSIVISARTGANSAITPLNVASFVIPKIRDIARRLIGNATNV